MAYPSHYLLDFGGSLLDGQDTWSNHIRFTTGLVDVEGALDDITTDVSTMIATANSGYSAAVHLEYVKLNEIDALGHYADQTTTHVRELTTPVSGTSSAVYIPQVSLCVSLLTANARGYASKGRVFVPIPALSPSSTNGKLSATVCTNVANAWAQFIANLGNTPGLDVGQFQPAVVSSVPVEGAINEVTAVRVGDVLDTQQRRRRQIPELYQTAPVP